MKKTLVALAVLAASGASFAQATITGQYGFGYRSGAEVETGFSTSDSNVNFSASEDLGGGLKVAANVKINSTNRDSVSGGDEAISLSGGFGTLSMGSVEYDTDVVDQFGSTYFRRDTMVTFNKVDSERTSDFIQYSTSFGPVGFYVRHTESNQLADAATSLGSDKVALASTSTGTTSTGTTSTGTTSTGTTTTGTTTTGTTTTGTTSTGTTTTGTTTADSTTAGSTTAASTTAASTTAASTTAGAPQPLNTIAVSYAAGPVSVKADYSIYEKKLDGIYDNRTTLGGSFNFGAGTVAVGYQKMNLTKGEAVTDAIVGLSTSFGALDLGLDFMASKLVGNATAAYNKTYNGTGFQAKYNLSKRTDVRLRAANYDKSFGDAEKTTDFSLVMQHSF